MIFSGLSIEAMKAGRKTQTTRVLKPGCSIILRGHGEEKSIYIENANFRRLYQIGQTIKVCHGRGVKWNPEDGRITITDLELVRDFNAKHPMITPEFEAAEGFSHCDVIWGFRGTWRDMHGRNDKPRDVAVITFKWS